MGLPTTETNTHAKVISLDHIITLISGRDAPLDACNDQGKGIPYILGASNLSHNKFTAERWIEKPIVVSKKGDLLLSVKGTVGTTYLQTEEEIGISRQIMALRPSSDLNLIYLQYYLEYTCDILKKISIGLIPGISRKNILDTKIPLPPLAEQHRIVAKIEELFAELDRGIAGLEKAKAQLKTYRQAVLNSAFQGRLTQNTVSTHIHNEERFIISGIDELTAKLPPLPVSWRYVYLSQLGELTRGRSKHRPRNDSRLFENGKYPFIQTGDIKAANKYLSEYTTQYGEYGLEQSKLWPIGTLCITIAANIAETAILSIDACFPDSVVGFKNDDKIVSIEYIQYFFESTKAVISSFAPATAQKNINLNTLEKLIIPYCSLDEQVSIVHEINSRFSLCDSLEKSIDSSLKNADLLRMSILKKAFAGELIQQDPADASSLILSKENT